MAIDFNLFPIFLISWFLFSDEDDSGGQLPETRNQNTRKALPNGIKANYPSTRYHSPSYHLINIALCNYGFVMVLQGKHAYLWAFTLI